MLGAAGLCPHVDHPPMQYSQRLSAGFTRAGSWPDYRCLLRWCYPIWFCHWIWFGLFFKLVTCNRNCAPIMDSASASSLARAWLYHSGDDGVIKIRSSCSPETRCSSIRTEYAPPSRSWMGSNILECNDRSMLCAHNCNRDSARNFGWTSCWEAELFRGWHLVSIIFFSGGWLFPGWPEGLVWLLSCFSPVC